LVISIKFEIPVKLFCDDKSVIAHNLVQHNAAKHVTLNTSLERS